MEKKYQSEALMVSHQSAESLFRLGVISEAEMKEFDNICFAEEEPEVNFEDEKSTVLKHITA
jgi:DNA-binding transcriptional regulator YiaG